MTTHATDATATTAMRPSRDLHATEGTVLQQPSVPNSPKPSVRPPLLTADCSYDMFQIDISIKTILALLAGQSSSVFGTVKNQYGTSSLVATCLLRKCQ